MYIGIEGAVRIAITVIILVFFILSLLALLMVGLREIVKLTTKKPTDEKQASLTEKINAGKPEIEEIQKESEEDDEKLVAAISAAISIFMARPVQQINIINIKRSMPAGANPWTISGKQSLMSNAFSVSSRKIGGFKK